MAIKRIVVNNRYTYETDLDVKVGDLVEVPGTGDGSHWAGRVTSLDSAYLGECKKVIGIVPQPKSEMTALSSETPMSGGRSQNHSFCELVEQAILIVKEWDDPSKARPAIAQADPMEVQLARALLDRFYENGMFPNHGSTGKCESIDPKRKVRIAIAFTPDGRWNSAGYHQTASSQEEHEALLKESASEFLEVDDGGWSLAWIDAVLPPLGNIPVLPGTIVVVEGQDEGGVTNETADPKEG